jgi:hypothetical protein
VLLPGGTLRSLTVVDCKLGDAGLGALAASAGARLQKLHLSDLEGLSDAGL